MALPGASVAERPGGRVTMDAQTIFAKDNNVPASRITFTLERKTNRNVMMGQERAALNGR